MPAIVIKPDLRRNSHGDAQCRDAMVDEPLMNTRQL